MKTFAVAEKHARPAARRAAGPVPHPAGPRLRAQRAEIRHILHGPRLQTKLKIGAPDDAYEREADRVADRVMRMPAPVAEETPVAGREDDAALRRLCPECEDETLRRQPAEEEEEELLQAKASPGAVPEVTPGIDSRIQALRGGGLPLSESVRAFFEPRFGHDFSQVRVHTDAPAAAAARAVNARAFTVGRDITFGPSAYSPESTQGKRLLAHELTHVVQQTPSVAQNRENTSRSLQSSGPVLQREEPKREPTTLEKLDAELEEFWPADKDILKLLGELNSSERQTVLAGYKDKIAKELSEANMVEALDILGADYATSRDWLKANEADVYDIKNGADFLEGTDGCSLDADLKTRVRNLCEHLITHLLVWRYIGVTQGCRSKAKAHRWSTAYHILNGYVSLADLQAHLPPESKETGDEKQKDESSDQYRDLDGNLWYTRGWTLDEVETQAKSNYDSGSENKRLAYEGYAHDDPYRKPNSDKPPVSQHVHGQAMDVTIMWTSIIGKYGGRPWGADAIALVKKFSLKRPIDASNPYGADAAEPQHFEKA